MGPKSSGLESLVDKGRQRICLVAIRGESIGLLAHRHQGCSHKRYIALRLIGLDLSTFGPDLNVRHRSAQSDRGSREVTGFRQAQSSFRYQVDDAAGFGVEIGEHAICEDSLLDKLRRERHSLLVPPASDPQALENGGQPKLPVL